MRAILMLCSFVLVIGLLNGCSSKQYDNAGNKQGHFSSKTNVSHKSAKKSDIIDQFETDVKQGNVEKLQALIKPSDPKMTITKLNIQDLIDYSKKHSNYLSQVVAILKKQKSEELTNAAKNLKRQTSNLIKSDSQSTSLSNSDLYPLTVIGDYNFNLIKNQITAHSYDLGIEFPFLVQNVTVTANGKAVKSPSGSFIGFPVDELPPGIYRIKVAYNKDGKKLTDNKTVYFYSNKKFYEPVFFDLKGATYKTY